MAYISRSTCRFTNLVLGCFLLFIARAGSFTIRGLSRGIESGSRTRPFRREISEFSKSGPAWDLFVLSLQKLQGVAPNDSLSFFQIASIHGYPAQPWDNVMGRGPNGFCMHSSVLFPIWHRPYLALYEQVLSVHATTIAQQYPVEQRDEYLAAAEFLRIPYWDWAQTFRLPDVVTNPYLDVKTPTGLQTIDNPLLLYRFPVNMQAAGYFPNFGQFSTLPFTARHYTQPTGSDQEGASASLLALSAARLSNLYELLVTRDNWTEFSAYQIAGVLNPGVSLEGLHGVVHNAIGGFQGQTALGHMTVTQLSAFDPVFWLHHANVDRIVAIWQALHPNSFVEPVINLDGTYFQPPHTPDTEDTLLAPFHSDEDGNMWTAATARDIATFGYTYPELIDWNANASELTANVRSAVNKLYNPPMLGRTNYTTKLRRSSGIARALSNIQADSVLRLGVNNMEIQWYLRLSISDLAASKATAIYLFVGEPLTTTPKWDRAPNLIGAFTPPVGVRFWNRTQRIDVPCSHTIAAAIDRGLLQSNSPGLVLEFLARNLVVEYVSQSGSAKVDLLRSIGISVVSRQVNPSKTLSDFPTYGAFQEHLDVTDIVLGKRRPRL